MKKILLWTAGGLLIIAVLVMAAARVLEEPLRKYAEREANRSLEGYSVSVQKIRIHPFSLSVDAAGLSVSQNANPSPPIALVAKFSAGIRWSALLKGRIAARALIENPRVHLDIKKIKSEKHEKKPVTEKGWQDAIRAVYPFKIESLSIVNGEMDYLDKEQFKPVHLTKIRFEAHNIQNKDNPEGKYPSDAYLEALFFGNGLIRASGKADFLASPNPSFKGRVEVSGLQLGFLQPIMARRNIDLREGVLWASGTAEYSKAGKSFALDKVKLKGVRADYVHLIETAQQEKEKAAKVKRTAKELAEKPETLIKIGRLDIEDGSFGFINRAVKPDYRVFIDRVDLSIENFSNHFSEGPARFSMKGLFMGSGSAEAGGTFRSEKNGPDFDLKIAINNTKLVDMNDLFRAYGKFDVVAGMFSFYSEFKVKDKKVDGYVKPIFSQMKVYDRRQDKEKALFRKLYEKLVGGVARLLRNPQKAIATETEVSGELENPKADTWQTLANLLRNAFLNSILPGFESNIRK